MTTATSELAEVPAASGRCGGWAGPVTGRCVADGASDARPEQFGGDLTLAAAGERRVEDAVHTDLRAGHADLIADPVLVHRADVGPPTDVSEQMRVGRGRPRSAYAINEEAPHARQ